MQITDLRRTSVSSKAGFSCYLGLTLSGQGFEKLAQTGGWILPPPLLTLLSCIRTKLNLVWANKII